MEYLVLTTQQVANDARRKLNANYLRHRSDWQESMWFGAALKNRSGADVEPDGKPDSELLDDNDLYMFGEKLGKANMTDGFTDEWTGEAKQRITDGKYVLRLPDDAEMKAELLHSIPQPNSIETFSPDWFERPIS